MRRLVALVHRHRALSSLPVIDAKTVAPDEVARRLRALAVPCVVTNLSWLTQMQSTYPTAESFLQVWGDQRVPMRSAGQVERSGGAFATDRVDERTVRAIAGAPHTIRCGPTHSI